MKHRQEINKEQAKRLKALVGLTPRDSLSNPAPSDLCAEYRMETGYCSCLAAAKGTVMDLAKGNQK